MLQWKYLFPPTVFAVQLAHDLLSILKAAIVWDKLMTFESLT